MNWLALIKSILKTPAMLKVNPGISWFLFNYLRKFKIKKIDSRYIIHSHLPPLNDKSYTRFVKQHLLSGVEGPSHAQIGITDKCPFNCEFCYNRDRIGNLMQKEEIKKAINELEHMGVTWLGLTGGEPLLNTDIVEIVNSISDNCVVKLFTTGYNLDKKLASNLKQAGLFYVSVSLDHWQEEKHDRIRGYKGAYITALKAIRIFKEVGCHVGVSAVLTREMINEKMDEFMNFLIDLDVHEAWLSEVKPSVKSLFDRDHIITAHEQQKLIKLQDEYNRNGEITVNYLGHLEGKENFGCCAGNKMIFIDPLGEVSPCVFTPMSFGNLREEALSEIYREMREHFPTDDSCFINKNFPLLSKYNSGQYPLQKEETLLMMKEVEFGPLSKFNEIFYKKEN